MNEIKAFSIRISKEMWKFLRQKSIDEELPVNVLIGNCLEKYKKSCEKKLTDEGTLV